MNDVRDILLVTMLSSGFLGLFITALLRRMPLHFIADEVGQLLRKDSPEVNRCCLNRFGRLLYLARWISFASFAACAIVGVLLEL